MMRSVSFCYKNYLTGAAAGAGESWSPDPQRRSVALVVLMQIQ